MGAFVMRRHKALQRSGARVVWRANASHAVNNAPLAVTCVHRALSAIPAGQKPAGKPANGKHEQ
jgi:hypothetical protein